MERISWDGGGGDENSLISLVLVATGVTRATICHKYGLLQTQYWACKGILNLKYTQIWYIPIPTHTRPKLGYEWVWVYPTQERWVPIRCMGDTRPFDKNRVFFVGYGFWGFIYELGCTTLAPIS